ncbi:AtpZ/AtpI family protein [Poseidonocella sp. HB161398]|uniref:AtpZ/AtpI family protein n=1 Tax=Poseidonocella sp. HB161398 TaxID=2320855 RepID=UPI0011090E07|nr:AtpZ/AtpI family protein [Poseidonocella sp. HB161398]
MTDPDNGDRLRQLEERLDALRQKQAPAGRKGGDKYSQANIAWTMVTELVAGLAIGCGIGMGLDAILGTRPWLLVLFTLLGFAAGVKTMMHTAGEVQKEKQAAKAAEARKHGSTDPEA